MLIYSRVPYFFPDKRFLSRQSPEEKCQVGSWLREERRAGVGRAV